ncbi:MAG: hypothetical protein RLY43_2090 [Bacteroidota bacterium]
MFKKILLSILALILILVAFYFYLAKRPVPEKIDYGVSFNTLYAKELNLDWEVVYKAILDDLGVRRFRLAAHWNMVEPEDDQWNFVELDKQLDLARERNAKVILSVGRRLPRWPECHIPHWAINKEWNNQKEEILEYMQVVVNRYKDYANIIYWQVENEPYLEVFAKEHCGELDEEFLAKQVEFVKNIDSSRPVLVTDSGNLGTWYKPWKYGDLFGTSVYVYLWNKEIGPFKSYLPPSFYRAKTSLMEIFVKEKRSMLIELSLEPWLLQPVVETPIKTQLERMNINKFREIIDFAKETRFSEQYLWGAEWWYYMNQNGQPEFWNEAKKIFN